MTLMFHRARLGEKEREAVQSLWLDSHFEQDSSLAAPQPGAGQ